MKSLFQNVWFWFTHDYTRVKSLLVGFLTAAIVWGGSIWYTEANPDRLLMGDFSRLEVWLAIVGGLAGMLIVPILKGIGKRRREKASQDKLKG